MEVDNYSFSSGCAVRRVKLELLKEFDFFCISNDIEYSLTDETLVAFLNGIELDDFTGDFVVMLTPGNYFKYLDLVASKGLPGNRCIENVYNNGAYPAASSRYVATNTLSVNLIASSYLYRGIFLTIKMMCPFDAEGRGAVRQVSLKAWEKNLTRLHKYLHGYFQFFAFLGVRKRKKNILLLKDAYRKLDLKAVKYRYGLKNSLLEFNIDKDRVGDISRVEFLGFYFNVYSSLLETDLVRELQGLVFPAKNDKGYIESAFVCYQDYKSKLCLFDRFLFYYSGFMDWFYLRNIRRIEKASPFSMNKYLRRFSYKFYIYKFYRELCPRLSIISELIEKKKYEELRDELSSYSIYFEYFYAYKKLLVVDQRLFEAYVCLLRAEGRFKFADEVVKRFGKVYPDIKLIKVEV